MYWMKQAHTMNGTIKQRVIDLTSYRSKDAAGRVSQRGLEGQKSDWMDNRSLPNI